MPYIPCVRLPRNGDATNEYPLPVVEICAMILPMERNLSFLIQSIVFSSIALGCGGNSGGNAGTCNAAAPCGGTLDGTWQMDSTCVEGDLAAYLAIIPGGPFPACTQVQTATAAMAGTAAFASGIETDNLTITFDASVSYSPACVGTIGGTTTALDATACTGFQQTLLNRQYVSTAACSFEGGDCACSVSLEVNAPAAPQAYTISGSRISYANGGTPLDYCVSGTTLTTRDAESHATFYNTAHKL